jgi:SAM-dependent methyltransferase
VSAGQRRGVWREDDRAPARQSVALAWAERRVVLDHHLFNAERDRWPFDDAIFDCVLCAEVVEHLVFSPTHVLFEASRVLADDGALVVTTPNALAATKLARLLRGRNVHGPYSGYGAHGRHNREFTRDELVELVELAGFDPSAETKNLREYRADDLLGRVLQSLAGVAWPSRRDHLFVVGRKRRAPQLAFPPHLYRSVDRARMRADGVFLPDERGAGTP